MTAVRPGSGPAAHHLPLCGCGVLLAAVGVELHNLGRCHGSRFRQRLHHTMHSSSCYLQALAIAQAHDQGAIAQVVEIDRGKMILFAYLINAGDNAISIFNVVASHQ